VGKWNLLAIPSLAHNCNPSRLSCNKESDFNTTPNPYNIGISLKSAYFYRKNNKSGGFLDGLLLAFIIKKQKNKKYMVESEKPYE